MAVSTQFNYRTLWSLVAVGCLSTASPLAADDAPPTTSKPAIGDKLAAFSFKDIRYLPRSLNDLASPKDPVKTRAFVLVFTNTTCPLVQKYLPRLKELDAEYRDRGIKVVAVNVGVSDSIVAMAAQAVNHEAGFPFVKDRDGSCVRACGVERTPEVVLIDAEHHLRYRGRIDDQYRLSGAAPSATRTELKNAIESLLNDRPIEVSETPVDGCRITLSARNSSPTPVTYHEHVAPLIRQHCANCHRPNTAAPFSLTTYQEVADHAAMIAEVVAEQRMPPWYASEEFGSFTNCRKLADRDRDKIVAWAESGVPSGTEPPTNETPTDDVAANKESAEPVWLMGKPDLVIEIPGAYSVPADGYVDYIYTPLPHLFLNDCWIQGAEVLPDNPRVVHHCNLGSATIGGQPRLITGYVPGVGPMVLSEHVAVKLDRGAMLGIQLHLTTTGKPEKCRIKIGFRFARNRIQQELRYLEIANYNFTIPPFAPFHEVSSSRTLSHDATIYGMFAHMHVRGRDITFRAYPPQGDPETLLVIPNYSFDWQMPYELRRGARKFPAGTRFECKAHYDNSTFNPFNPDPAATVREGQQTFQEMMYGYVFYTRDQEALNLTIDPNTGQALP